MESYKAKTFDIPELTGISASQIDEHLKLYNGYVTHTNKISEQIKGWIADDREKNSYVIHELWRRLGFEFNGMRIHEYYFGALDGGTTPFDPQSTVGKAIIGQYGSYEAFVQTLMHVGTTRGSGWATLYYDTHTHTFIATWADEHHIGHLASLPLVLAIDCWEHAYMVDYLPGERAKYITAYLENINWKTVDNWFQKAQMQGVQ